MNWDERVVEVRRHEFSVSDTAWADLHSMMLRVKSSFQDVMGREPKDDEIRIRPEDDRIVIYFTEELREDDNVIPFSPRRVASRYRDRDGCDEHPSF